jgi:hypothetical protein
MSSTLARPSTPMNTPKAPSAPSTPVTGTWKHPQLDEIVRRQNASNFTDRNMRMLMYNFGGIVTVWALGRHLWNKCVLYVVIEEYLANWILAFRTSSWRESCFTLMQHGLTTCCNASLYTTLLWHSSRCFGPQTRFKTSLSRPHNGRSLVSHRTRNQQPQIRNMSLPRDMQERRRQSVTHLTAREAIQTRLCLGKGVHCLAVCRVLPSRLGPVLCCRKRWEVE